MFELFKKALQGHIQWLIHHSGNRLYVADVAKDTLWDAYLTEFVEEEQQGHNCNACKSFIRHFGNVVGIVDNKIVSIWDFDNGPSEYKGSVEALRSLVKNFTIRDVFFSVEDHVGLDKNREKKEDGKVITWEHMFYRLPAEMVAPRGVSAEKLMGDAKDIRNVFKRSLDEITLEAINTVLELIDQNSLYRGMENKLTVTHFQKIKTEYDKIAPEHRENFCWAQAGGRGQAVAKIRNTAIGTLLTDISEGKELDVAVRSFEAIMAPANYKRPNAIITQKMVEQAEKTIEELGYERSLGRRFATIDDINVSDVLFVDRGIVGKSGALASLKESLPVNPKSLAKLEEVSVDKFLKDILPKCTRVEILVENRHVNSLVSLITAKTAGAPFLFKWNNPFSWSYKDAVADSMKEKVKKAGGKVDGELRVSLEWSNFDDLDLHVIEPGGFKIHFPMSNKKSITGGELDVDMNASGDKSREPVENIIWPSQSGMREGKYIVQVNQYNQREKVDFGFSVEVECQGELLTFGYDNPLATNDTITVVEFEYAKKKGITILSGLAHTGAINSRKVWNLDTSKFHPASMILHSPNYWGDKAIGNDHLIFVIDKAHNDETARGFFNEFLKPELEIHKRVFEALGSRMRVDPADVQVSGLGFSSTQRNDLICTVSGAFTRTLRIKF